ncbi:MAG TPA: hypothetical protein PL195_05280, partial [bacterium]|nr:hypothetical protein [bacterium]
MRKILLLLAMSSFLLQNIFAWNVTSFPKDNRGNLRNYQYDDNLEGHQWITKIAYDELKKRGIKFRALNDETISYVFYGGKFADDPWVGRPEKPGDYVRGVLDNINDDIIDIPYSGQSYDVHENKMSHVKLSFVNRKSFDRPNIYMEINSFIDWWGSSDPGDNIYQDRHYAADNYFHFPSKENGGDGIVGLSNFYQFDSGVYMPVKGGWVFTGSDVGIINYGTLLYGIARKFWNINRGAMPSINQDFE